MTYRCSFGAGGASPPIRFATHTLESVVYVALPQMARPTAIAIGWVPRYEDTVTKRLLVTGASGFVAGSVIAQAGPGWEIIAQSRRALRDLPPGVEHLACSVCDTDRLEQAIDRFRPQAILHAAAIADIDFCQSHRDQAEEVNVRATRDLARLARAFTSHLVLCSTDTVFDGNRGMYREDDPTGPVNYYAETKVRAEQAVRDAAGSATVARLALVVGLPLLGTGNAFLPKMLEQLAAGQPVRGFQNEVRTPVDVVTLGRALLELAGTRFSGTIHLAGNSRLTRYAMTQQIADRFGYPRERIEAADSSTLPNRAPRPSDVSLDNTKARSKLDTPICDLAAGLERIIERDRDHEGTQDPT